ncbi:chemotaxis protein CheA [Uliginosibacterium sp. H1]|uniref:chemotaxis protein CheA n=1 Tax=Uliginosibacterium sp. H1 TaxID=3114757 RepID=UPI002E186F9C|nr:ATP-binding protein [Uliginosibacterium sp. H1]
MSATADDFDSSFLSESGEQLALLESLLLQLERSPGDAALADALLRSAHTLKGSAGMMGLAEIEQLAHALESVLERLRSGALAAVGAPVSDLLVAVDLLRKLVGSWSLGDPAGLRLYETERLRVQEGLARHAGLTVVRTEVVPTASGADVWTLELSFEPGVLRQGLDPAYFLQHLTHLGRILDLRVHQEDLPLAAQYQPEDCYLRFTVLLETSADKADIEHVFAFVRSDCHLRMHPPPERHRALLSRIRALPEGRQRLAELLVEVGAITDEEMRRALALQASGAHPRSIGEVLVDAGFVDGELVAAAVEKQADNRARQAGEVETVRVPRESLEELLALVFNMAQVARNVQTQAERGGSSLHGELEAMDMLAGEAVGTARRLLMLPVREAFRRSHRVLRDLARELGKEVELSLQGEELEVDRLQVERLGEVVLHLLRNALDHGIETPAEREAVGKARCGRITVSLQRDGDSLAMTLADDGRGIDHEQLRQRAVERGLLRAGSQHSEAELLELIFSPGFSTARDITHVSGRGVGLDVVRETLRALRGDVTVSTRPGAGTTFTLRLPASAAQRTLLADGSWLVVDHTQRSIHYKAA